MNTNKLRLVVDNNRGFVDQIEILRHSEQNSSVSLANNIRELQKGFSTEEDKLEEEDLDLVLETYDIHRYEIEKNRERGWLLVFLGVTWSFFLAIFEFKIRISSNNTPTPSWFDFCLGNIDLLVHFLQKMSVYHANNQLVDYMFFTPIRAFSELSIWSFSSLFWVPCFVGFLKIKKAHDQEEVL